MNSWGYRNIALLQKVIKQNYLRPFIPKYSFCTSFVESLTESEYEHQSEETLSALSDYMDALPELVTTDPGFDVSYSMGVLTINIGSNFGIYVINKQTPNRQIWLSSPISGPKRYDLTTAGKWVYKHDGVSLLELLEQELRSIYKTDAIKLESNETRTKMVK